jgi:hypothetical protein
MNNDDTSTMSEVNTSMVQGKSDRVSLLDLHPASSSDAIRRGLRAELKRLHPDAGGDRSPSDLARFEALLVARDRWQRESSDRDPASVAVRPWFDPPPRGAEPRPGFWTRGPGRAARD